MCAAKKKKKSNPAFLIQLQKSTLTVESFNALGFYSNSYTFLTKQSRMHLMSKKGNICETVKKLSASLQKLNLVKVKRKIVLFCLAGKII